MPENNTWRKIIARNPGVCVICNGEIIVGENIQNNSEQRINRHQKCVKELHEIDILKEKIIKLFILGDNQKATELYGEMAEIEANKIITDHEVENKEIKIETNDDKNKEFENKLKNDKELKNAANDLTYPKFVEIFRKKYLIYAKVILGDNFHAVMIAKNKGIELRKKFDDKITHKFYSDWTEKKLQQKSINKDTPSENMRNLTNTIDECNNYIYWIDRYHDKKSMEILFSNFNQSKIKDIKIISSGFVGNTIDHELHDYVVNISKEFLKQNISICFKIITDLDIHNDTHNRYILSSNLGYDVPSFDAIRKGQNSTINPLESKILKHKTREFLIYWEKEKVLDIVKDWKKIDEFLEKTGYGKNYRRNCKKCGSFMKVKPQFRNENGLCGNCYRNSQH